MKITGINVRQVEVPLIEPFRISLGVITHSKSAIVSVETDEGLVGYGEGAPGILITGETLAGTAECIRAFERDLTVPLPMLHAAKQRLIWHVMTYLVKKQDFRYINFLAETRITWIQTSP